MFVFVLRVSFAFAACNFSFGCLRTRCFVHDRYPSSTTTSRCVQHSIASLTRTDGVGGDKIHNKPLQQVVAARVHGKHQQDTPVTTHARSTLQSANTPPPRRGMVEPAFVMLVLFRALVPPLAGPTDEPPICKLVACALAFGSFREPFWFS